ncbi:hypothetical protein [Telluria aromaticivorans]|uniref:Uncharacterized protein n=1 Tax=Telluria aromaticivorans TaxID=2725995 RepID=A0A7Y2P2J1_9BURK|nr:hypothetical protein [Telluria aromaticivorans]NNG25691.1 hypothetical protein [Telluria aromaticivorans]
MQTPTEKVGVRQLTGGNFTERQNFMFAVQKKIWIRCCVSTQRRQLHWRSTKNSEKFAMKLREMRGIDT